MIWAVNVSNPPSTIERGECPSSPQHPSLTHGRAEPRGPSDPWKETRRRSPSRNVAVVRRTGFAERLRAGYTSVLATPSSPELRPAGFLDSCSGRTIDAQDPTRPHAAVTAPPADSASAVPGRPIRSVVATPPSPIRSVRFGSESHIEYSAHQVCRSLRERGGRMDCAVPRVVRRRRVLSHVKQQILRRAIGDCREVRKGGRQDRSPFERPSTMDRMDLRCRGLVLRLVFHAPDAETPMVSACRRPVRGAASRAPSRIVAAIDPPATPARDCVKSMRPRRYEWERCPNSPGKQGLRMA